MERWQRDEIDACARLGADHVGGPGKPDCVGDDYIVEVKSYNGRPIHKGVIRRTLEKRWADGRSLKIVSVSGYTAGAIELAAHEGIELYVKEGRRVYSLSSEEDTARDDSSVVRTVIGTLAVAGLVVGGIAWLSGR